MSLLSEMNRILAIEAYEAELNARLAARREKRPAHREAARKGWQRRRTA